METWQDIKDFFFSAVQDTEAGQMFFSTTQAAAWANAALWEYAVEAKFFDVIQEQNTVDGTAVYAVGDALTPPVEVWRVEIDDEKIRAINTDELRRVDRRWPSRSGQPNFYYMDEVGAGDAATVYIGLHDEPNGVYELRTYSYGIPAQVSDSADTDSVQVPKWAIYGVLWYMLSEAYMAETSRQNFDTSMFYRRLYEGTLERLQSIAANKLGHKSWVVGEGYSYSDPGFWGNMPEHIPEP